MTSKKKLILASLALLVVAGGAVSIAHAQHGEGTGGHDHGQSEEKAAAGGHDHHASAGNTLATEQLKLNNGQRWQTDAALREGMSGIRADVEAAIPLIHGGKYTPADYEKLAKGIEARVNQIIATCKLPPEADAQLHLVVADAFAGASTMKADGDRSAGAVKLIKALDAYGKFFDQPGWTPIAH